MSFAADPGAREKRLRYDLSPYLLEPVTAWDFRGHRREITIVAPEQTGKTLAWQAGFLWAMLYRPCLSLVVYKSDEQSERLNTAKLRPMMGQIPELAAELELPKALKKDNYSFTNLRSFFIGAGTRIAALSARICVADELDDWVEHEGQVANLEDLRKRMRTFPDSLLVKACSPTGGATGVAASKIWGEFLTSSRGYWTLRCCKCKELTMRSCDIRHLQFKATDQHEVISGSCRLVCPACGYPHSEDKRPRLNQRGAYVHEVPGLRLERPGFQWGALAVAWESFGWDNIARAQLNAGQSGSLSDQVLFDNSYRGLPFVARKRDEKRRAGLLRHQAPLPAPAAVVSRLMAVDTQDDCFWWVVRGWDTQENSYLLGYGKAVAFSDLDAAWERKHHGDLAELCLIDSGGHRTNEVSAWVRDRQGCMMYKGAGSQGARWKASAETPKLLLVNPNAYAPELLWTIYSQEHRPSGYWYLCNDLGEEYIEQVLDFRPDNKKRGGDRFENWISTGNDHLFDCEKQLLVAREVRKSLEKGQPTVARRLVKVPQE